MDPTALKHPTASDGGQGPDWLTPADLHAWHVLAPLARTYLPWSSGALRPSALVTVLNDVVVNDRRTVVECGGGVSTVFLARLLAERDRGTLTSVEHDPDWVALLRESLEREGLTGRVTLVHAPLVPHPEGWGSPWYDPDALARGLPEQPIDLLLVDGPPAHTPGTERARYPALPVLGPRLAADATVVLDDVGRPGERDVLERWEVEHGLRFERRLDQGGIGIARADGSEPPAT